MKVTWKAVHNHSLNKNTSNYKIYVKSFSEFLLFDWVRETKKNKMIDNFSSSNS